MYEGAFLTTGSGTGGLPELALGLQALIRGFDRKVVQSVVMGGHRDGLLTFGPDLDGAGAEALGLAGRIRD